MKALVVRAVGRAARRYIAGPEIADAVAAAGLRPATYGYWDGPRDTPELVAAEYRAAFEATRGRDAYVSVKATALGFDPGLLAEVGGPVHLDALELDTVDRTWALAERVAVLGVTLPGRWRRSAADVARVAEWGVRVRVVKGQFPAPDDRDPREGFLDVVERLAAAGVERIAIGSHDPSLVGDALRRAPHAEVEQLYGIRAVPHPHRVYVPFGTAYLPYAIANLRKNPRVLWWLARDFATRPSAKVSG